MRGRGGREERKSPKQSKKNSIRLSPSVSVLAPPPISSPPLAPRLRAATAFFVEVPAIARLGLSFAFPSKSVSSSRGPLATAQTALRTP